MLSEFFTAGDHLISDGAGFFETDYGFTPWINTQENSFPFSPNNPPKPVFSNSGSDNNSTPNSNTSGEVIINAIDERKKRRMISNRESARRSRMRKQKHVENLRNQMSRLKITNRDLTNRLRVINLNAKLVREENRCLQSESKMLQQRLWDIRQVLLVRQLHHQLLLPSTWPCNNNNISYNIHEHNNYPPSLIT